VCTAGLTGRAYFRSWMRLTNSALSMDDSAEHIQSYKVVELAGEICALPN